MNAFSEDSTPHTGARRGRRMRPRLVRIGVFLTFVLSVGMVVASPPVDAAISTDCTEALAGFDVVQQIPSPPSPISSEFAMAVIDAVDNVFANCAAEDLGDGFFAEIREFRFWAETWLNCAEIGAIATADLTCTVPAGMRVVVPAGQSLPTFVLLLNYGVLENHGVVSVGARGLFFENFGTIDNHGVIDIGPIDQHPLVTDQHGSGSLSNHGTLNNEGTVRTHGDLIDLNSDLSTLQYGLLFNDGTINSSGDLIIAGGFISSEADGSVVNDGTITNTSLFVSEGNFDNNGTITNDLLFVSDGTFDNNGSIVSSDSSTFVNQPGGTFNNRSALDIYGRFSIGGTLNNASTINIFGIVGNDGVLHNDGTVHIDPRNEEDLSNYLLPDGTFLPFPFFTNLGTVEQDCDAVFSGAASWQFDGIAPVDVCVVKHRLEVLSEPCVVYSSQDAVAAGLDGMFVGDESRTVQVTGTLSGQGGDASCVPVGASAVVYTISAVDPQGIGNLRLSPEGVVANGGVVNYQANGLNNANTVTVPLGVSGAVDVVANNSGTDVRLVAVGFYSEFGVLRYTPITPCAVSDSRASASPAGVFAGPFTVGDDYPDIDVAGVFSADQGGGNTDCGIPAGVDAVAVNIVAIRPQGTDGFNGAGFVSAAASGLDPTETTTPFADLNLNNAATTIIPLNGGDTIAVDIEGDPGAAAEVRVVALGYYTDSVSGGDYTPVTPCAAFDSRTGQGATGAFLGKRVAGTATTYTVTGTVPGGQGGGGGDCGVPVGATGVLINLVAIQPDAVGNYRAYATGTTPTGGILNFAPLSPPMNNSNAIVVPLSTAGQLDLFTNAPANNGNATVHARGIILGYYN